MSDPYPYHHPDQVREYDHESLFHSNASDYNQPASVNEQHEEHFVNNVQNDDIMQIARSALQNELFADNDLENDDMENNGQNGIGNNAQNDGMENNMQNDGMESSLQNDHMQNHVQDEQFAAHEVPFESNGTLNKMDENNLLWPVLPGESGEGLPYAPIDWPYPGDVWTWRVGKRTATSGYFQDRFLYLPKRIGRQMFASKATVANYIKSHFPGADVDAFFASFAWKIPVKMQSPTKVEPAPPPSVEEKVAGQEEEKADTVHSSLRRRRRRRTVVASSTPQIEVDEEPSLPITKRGKRGGSKLSLTPKPKRTKQSGTKLSPGPKKARESKAELLATPKRTTRQPTRRSSRTVPVPDVEVVEEPVIEPIPEDFDNYLSSLEDILTQPVDVTQVNSSTTTYDSTAAQIEMAEARSKLSSLLVVDFTSLISPKNVTELTTLASKLRKDPTMNAEQLVKLKLIEEIPSYSEVYLESRELIDQVDEFFSALVGKKAKVATLKNEYSELKEKADQLQSQVDANAMAVDEIDRQIALLRSRRVELTNAIESYKAAKDEVTYSQKVVANSIPKVVNEIQVANSKLPDLELKRTNAVKREAEIRAKFAPLEGFSL